MSAAISRLCANVLGIVVVLAASTPAFGNDSAGAAALRRAAEYLWAQQADDGGWHSPQYAVLRSGQALTPFVLHALLQVPESVYPRPASGVERALEFIRSHVRDDGSLGHSDADIIEYPIYSTAYAIQCLTAVASDPNLAKESDTQLIQTMADFLGAAQFDDGEGFAFTNPAYGGWGFDIAKGPADPGHMDLAHTRRALDALREAGGDRSDCFARAEEFLRVVQGLPKLMSSISCAVPTLIADNRFDGGFYFSPIVENANKGRLEDPTDGQTTPRFRSYATATCDGILALLAAGVSPGDSRIGHAVEWLRTHDDLTYPEGVPADHPEPWGEAIRFYHYAARSEAYAALHWPAGWQSRLAREVARRQSADGSFRNDASPLMKEDDPVLCTALAAIALTHCHDSLSEHSVDPTPATP